MDINRKTLTAVLVLSAAAGLVYWSMENRGPDLDYNFDEQKEEQLKQNQPEVYQELKDKLDRAESILRQDDKEATAWMDIALSSHQLGDLKTAEQAYKNALAEEKANSLAWINLAAIYKEQGRFQDAKDAYLTLIDVRPTDTQAYLGLAEMYVAGNAGTVADAKGILEFGIQNTNDDMLKQLLKRLNEQGHL